MEIAAYVGVTIVGTELATMKSFPLRRNRGDWAVH